VCNSLQQQQCILFYCLYCSSRDWTRDLPICKKSYQALAFCVVDSPKKSTENKIVNSSKKIVVQCIKLRPKLVQLWLSWVFATQERKKERGKKESKTFKKIRKKVMSILARVGSESLSKMFFFSFFHDSNWVFTTNERQKARDSDALFRTEECATITQFPSLRKEDRKSEWKKERGCRYK